MNPSAVIYENGDTRLYLDNGKVTIDESLCTGCGLCSKLCPVKAIRRAGEGS